MKEHHGRIQEERTMTFRIEVDEKLNMNLFTELIEQTQSQQVTVNQEVHTDQKVSSLSKLESTCISEGIEIIYK